MYRPYHPGFFLPRAAPAFFAVPESALAAARVAGARMKRGKLAAPEIRQKRPMPRNPSKIREREYAIAKRKEMIESGVSHLQDLGETLILLRENGSGYFRPSVPEAKRALVKAKTQKEFEKTLRLLQSDREILHNLLYVQKKAKK